MQTGADTTVMFDDLKTGLAAPIAGMSISFTSSLFGLSGSLMLGFLDLQAGQAQNRFYTELEDFLAATPRLPRRRSPRCCPKRSSPPTRWTSARAPPRWPISPRASRRSSPICARSSS